LIQARRGAACGGYLPFAPPARVSISRAEGAYFSRAVGCGSSTNHANTIALTFLRRSHNLRARFFVVVKILFSPVFAG
jgi:hypothetical protein